MNYLLVRPEQLEGQGYDYRYAERIPDGRIILPLSALKVLSDFTPDIISDDSLSRLIKEQEQAVSDIPSGTPEADPLPGTPEGTDANTEGGAL